MNNSYDIIIIGAGPAGTTAALYANQLGLKTIIVDKSTFPRDKICGDALSGKSIRYIKELGFLDEISKLNGSSIKRIIFGSPNHKQFNLHLENKSQTNTIKEGYVLKRKVFDNLLFEKAKKITKTKENFKVTDIIFDNNSNIKGGLKDGDIIIDIKGSEARWNILKASVNSISPGDTLELTIDRSGEIILLRIITRERPNIPQVL